jgi:cell division septation protein DedD
MEFESKTDTVAMEKALLDSVAAHETRNIQIKYMVQIGAFKDPQLATAVQSAARERYHLPVLNDFNTSHTLYQIRIGFFETREDAYDFRQKMRGDFPQDYKDAWVVQLKR